MPMAPVDYGPQVAADTQGVQAAQQATAQHAQVFADAHNLGKVVEGGAQSITQGILHTQALQATAAVKEAQAKTLQDIDTNRYIPKAVLQQRMLPDDYTAWHVGLSEQYKDQDVVPMFTVAGALFDSDAKKNRAAASKIISLPGWREGWDATERTESATIRERYVNRMAADQMIADQRAQGMTAVDTVVKNAVKPEDFDTASKMVESNPWLNPAERRVKMDEVLAGKDSFVAKNAMEADDTDVMKAELDKLKGPNAEKEFPNLKVNARLALTRELTRAYGFKAAKDIADKKVVGPNIATLGDEDGIGQVDHTGVETSLLEFKDHPLFADIVKHARAEVAQRDNLFHAKMSDKQKSILTAGQDPETGEFSMSDAMQDPKMRKASQALNEYMPDMLTALHKEDNRVTRIEAAASELERRTLQRQRQADSQENLKMVHTELDLPERAAKYRDWTVQQFDKFLLDQNMEPKDRAEAARYFAQFKKNGGKADERPQKSVAEELSAATAGMSRMDKEKVSSKYKDALLLDAHQFIRDNAELTPDKMTDGLRAYLRSKLITGKVVGSGTVWDDSTRYKDWEVNPKWAGMDFKDKDGSVVSSDNQRVPITRMVNGKQQKATVSRWELDAAKAEGWK